MHYNSLIYFDVSSSCVPGLGYVVGKAPKWLAEEHRSGPGWESIWIPDVNSKSPNWRVQIEVTKSDFWSEFPSPLSPTFSCFSSGDFAARAVLGRCGGRCILGQRKRGEVAGSARIESVCSDNPKFEKECIDYTTKANWRCSHCHIVKTVIEKWSLYITEAWADSRQHVTATQPKLHWHGIYSLAIYVQLLIIARAIVIRFLRYPGPRFHSIMLHSDETVLRVEGDLGSSRQELSQH